MKSLGVYYLDVALAFLLRRSKSGGNNFKPENLFGG